MENSVTIGNPAVSPNLKDYESLSHSFSWQAEQQLLNGLPDNKGLNIAYEAVERHSAN